MITKALQTKHYTLHNMKLLIVTCTYTTNIMYNTQHRDNCTQQWLRDDSAQSYISTPKRTNGRGPCTRAAIRIQRIATHNAENAISHVLFVSWLLNDVTLNYIWKCM